MIPLRISALNSLAQCPGFACLSTVDDSPGGAAANTGTAVGRMCELWHKGGEHAEAAAAAIRQTEAEVADHPKADFDEAKVWFTGYANDPRNKGVVPATSCEQTVYLTLGEFKFKGHLDQLRRNKAGALRVWDIKSGQGARLSACSCGQLDKTAMGGREMVGRYAWQIAGYALAATETLGETVLPGGIIRIRGYKWSNRCKWDKDDPAAAPVFFHMPWTLDVCHEMMASAHHILSTLAEGKVPMHPGTHCQWCPAGSPDVCGDMIADTFGGAA